MEGGGVEGMEVGQGEAKKGDSRGTQFVIQIFHKVMCLRNLSE